MQNKNRLGCLTNTGIFATLITALAIVGVAFASGSSMFSAGALNVQGDKSYGGVISHAQITECNACHTAPWEKATMADRCTNCHTDIAIQMRSVAQLHGVLYHGNPTLGCRHCHPEHRGANAPFTVMNVGDFPHDSFGFSLAGHNRTKQSQPFTCKDCHNDGLTSFSPDTCQNCHQQIDIVFTQTHVLEFGTACLACHDGVDRYGKNFNHKNFAFQLIGKHAEIACSQCHLDARSIADLQSKSKDCFSCHQKDDPHAGKFGNDCGVCHSSEGWQPAKFDHNLAAFKLEGEHANVKCEQCHINNVFKGTPSDCFSCHQKDDEHNGQFGTNCAACHTSNGWDNAKVDHSMFAFKLDGKHANVKCEQCHINNVLKGTPADCFSCHSKDDQHNGKFGKDCSACHTPNSWKDATFDHNLSAFKLLGKHADVKCEQCHINGVFKGTSTDCFSCHSKDDKHNGQFGKYCSACHTPNSWGNATFDHSSSNFPLTGGHTNVACTKCHTNGVFKGTPTACASCHADPAFHAGAFGTDCASCHNTSSWTRASFNLSHPEPAGGEGGSGITHGGATCRQCHPSSVFQASCTACHESNNPGGGD